MSLITVANPRASSITRALIGGVGDVLSAPTLIVLSAAAMLIVAVPFGMALGERLQQSLAHQQPVGRDVTEIDADWWQEFLERADGMAATFTPAIIGAAAPLDNLSSLLDGTYRPLILMVPIAVGAVAWAFLWGAALDRFAHGRRSAGLWRSGTRMFVRYLAISTTAAAAVLVLYYTVHPLLFDVIAERLQMSLADERTAFAGRVVLYLIFGCPLIAVGLVADYARIQLVLLPDLTAMSAIGGSWQFVRRHATSVIALYLSTAAPFVLLLASYAALEIAGDFRVGGWRGVVIAQAYIIARIVVRLTFAAAELRLYRAVALDIPAHVP